MNADEARKIAGSDFPTQKALRRVLEDIKYESQSGGYSYMLFEKDLPPGSDKEIVSALEEKGYRVKRSLLSYIFMSRVWLVTWDV